MIVVASSEQQHKGWESNETMTPNQDPQRPRHYCCNSLWVCYFTKAMQAYLMQPLYQWSFISI